MHLAEFLSGPNKRRDEGSLSAKNGQRTSRPPTSTSTSTGTGTGTTTVGTTPLLPPPPRPPPCFVSSRTFRPSARSTKVVSRTFDVASNPWIPVGAFDGNEDNTSSLFAMENTKVRLFFFLPPMRDDGVISPVTHRRRRHHHHHHHHRRRHYRTRTGIPAFPSASVTHETLSYDGNEQHNAEGDRNFLGI
ncbi:hypothetical protein V1477_013663 [Vespula maculifrons]|uniref:Uncharacterized protein n=1 Tax=Vespula maculifrons TaxID=7453 RepID=A0ABD2BNX9_VESMC